MLADKTGAAWQNIAPLPRRHDGITYEGEMCLAVSSTKIHLLVGDGSVFLCRKLAVGPSIIALVSTCVSAANLRLLTLISLMSLRTRFGRETIHALPFAGCLSAQTTIGERGKCHLLVNSKFSGAQSVGGWSGLHSLASREQRRVLAPSAWSAVAAGRVAWRHCAKQW